MIQLIHYIPTTTPQYVKVRVELSAAVDALDSSQSSSTAAIERFHKDHLSEDLQKLADLEQLLDFTFVTSDESEIKVCGVFLYDYFLAVMHTNFRPRVCFYTYGRSISQICSHVARRPMAS